MRKLILLTVLISLASSLHAQSGLILHSEMSRETIIHHKGFSMSYNTSYVMPSWLTYKVTSSNVVYNPSFKPKYKPDPLVNTRSATKKDYDEGGYLMAQLANYLDVQAIDGAVQESFYMSNIVPMKLAFYQHIWVKTEKLIRLWVGEGEGFYIVCGPILTDAPFPTMGTNKVSVASRYYKIVYDANNMKAIGFVFKNGVSSGKLSSFAKSVDEIEAITGINFFPDLDEETEKSVENSIDFSFWNFNLEENIK